MQARLPIGTFINMATVTIGSLLGMYLQNSFPPNINAIIFQAIGLGTILIGMQMSFKIPDGYLLILIFSLIGGGILGELIHLDVFFQNTSEWLKNSLHISNEKFTEGLITAFLLFCIGSMTIVGAIEEGISGKRELLMVKSLLDGVTSIAFASTYGIGVLFSILPMLLFQGGMTVLAVQLQHIFTEKIIAMISAVGGMLIIGIAINLLQLGTINIENLLPSLILAVVFTAIYERFQK